MNSFTFYMTKTTSLNLKDFDKLNKVGRGTLGDVFLLKSKNGGEIYAGKFTINSISDTNAIHDLTQEINMISNINYPSIVKIIGLSQINYEKKHNPVVVTEYLPNGSLDNIINLAIHGNAPERWDDTQKLITLYGIASGMAFLHSHDILHCDLKPTNILIDEYLYPKICDFGISKVERSRIQSIIIPNEPSIYMAPELFSNNSFSKASDVYAFGIIAYQMINDESSIKIPVNTRKLIMRVKGGKRYKFEYPIYNSYKKLIENCWKQDLKKRLTFEQIKEELKTDPGFIIETVDEERFYRYVNFIDNNQISYITSPSIDPLNHLIEDEKINDDDDQAPDDFPKKVYKKLDQKNKDLVNKAIKENNPEAQLRVAINFIHRTNKFSKNSKLGIKYLKMAVDNGSISALKNYCRKIINGFLTSEDLKQAREKLALHVEDNDLEINLLYGLLLVKEKNIKQAQVYLESACKEGNPEAMYELGMIYFNQSDNKMAQEYFDMAKKNGYKKLQPNFENISNTPNQLNNQNHSNRVSSSKEINQINQIAVPSINKKKSKKHSKKGVKKLNNKMN